MKIEGSLLSVLFIIFLILKLCNVITWSWWLVCLPLIVPICFIIIYMSVGLIIYLFNKE